MNNQLEKIITIDNYFKILSKLHEPLGEGNWEPI